jgi:IS1 family transposase
MGTIKMKRQTIRAALATVSVAALSIGTFALAGTFGGHASADQPPPTIQDRSRLLEPLEGSHSSYTYTDSWPSAVDIRPWVKCVAVTHIETGKTGSDLTECQGEFDVKYWHNFTGGVRMYNSNIAPLVTTVTFKAEQNTERNKNNCPNTRDGVRYVKCLKVPGPSGGGTDGVVFSVGTHTGTDNTSSMRVDWDNGF